MSMKTLKADCPRCGIQNANFEILHANWIGNENRGYEHFESIDVYEVFCVCLDRECEKSTVFVVDSTGNPAADGSESEMINVVEYINQKHFIRHDPPKHLPKKIERAFKEGETCLAMDAVNAACTMFRACLDRAVRDMFAELTDSERKKMPKGKEPRGLKKRLDWLFEIGKIRSDFHKFSEVVKDYGDVGAHEVALHKEHKKDVEILMGFTRVLLEDRYTRREQLDRLKKKREEH